MGKVGVIIAAAGSGTRMGMDKNKVLLPLQGVPILIRSIKKFTCFDWVNEIIIVVRKEDYNEIADLTAKWELEVKLVVGGKKRQDSVIIGLEALSNKTRWVFIHDGARPLIDTRIIKKAYHQVQQYQAVGVGVPVKDTIKITNEKQMVVDTPDRNILWAIQTPQVFSYEIIMQAYREANKYGWESTDDCGLVEKLGLPVNLIPGSYKNIKITTIEDLSLASILLKNDTGGQALMKCGIGYDVHRLTKGRKLILAGIEIDYPYGLDGHSDADVVTHALMDSLLGAAGLGDIGTHFPDTEVKYLGISSIELLKQVMLKLKEKDYEVNNVDITIIAEEPKLAPYIKDMRTRLAQTLGITTENVNLKASTNEGLGFCGRREGIAVLATVTIFQCQD